MQQSFELFFNTPRNFQPIPELKSRTPLWTVLEVNAKPAQYRRRRNILQHLGEIAKPVKHICTFLRV